MLEELEGLASVATSVGVFIAVLAVRAAHLQRRRQFETLYVQRYWSLMDQLSLEARRGQHHNEVTVADEKIIRSYLRLCEDELELRKEGWISGETWEIWRTGILGQLRRWPFSVIWSDVNRETGPERVDQTIPEEFQLLRRFCSDQKDPKEYRSRRQRLTRRLLRGSP